MQTDLGTQARGRFTGAVANVTEMTGEDIHIRCSEAEINGLAEYAFQSPLYKVCIILEGGTRSTQAWADGKACYRGGDFPGAVTVIPAGSTRRAIMREGRYRVLAIAISPRSLRRVAERSEITPNVACLRPQNNAENPRIFAFARAMEGVLRQKPAPSTLFQDAIAAHFSNLLLRQAGHKARGQNNYGLPPRALQRCVDFVSSNLGEDISLEMLAAQTGLGEFAFLRAFKASTGETPHQFVLRARIERAKTLLVASGAPVTEIALDVGFSSHSHFSAAFRRSVGVSPRAFRSALVADQSGF
ncbi:MAG: helix-turn-helix transcriptional regulator [Chitinophagales bacterium]|nr:helix-turn-helix transcriptional regulator [Hyphomicrobiales bacterium]